MAVLSDLFEYLSIEQFGTLTDRYMRGPNAVDGIDIHMDVFNGTPAWRIQYCTAKDRFEVGPDTILMITRTEQDPDCLTLHSFRSYCNDDYKEAIDFYHSISDDRSPVSLNDTEYPRELKNIVIKTHKCGDSIFYGIRYHHTFKVPIPNSEDVDKRKNFVYNFLINYIDKKILNRV